MNEGFWRVGYETQRGRGVAVLTLDTGMVVGADIYGGVWDGEFRHNPREDTLDVKLRVHLPHEMISTVTGSVSDGLLEETYEFSIPNRLGLEITHKITLFGEDVIVTFKKIRDFPF